MEGWGKRLERYQKLLKGGLPLCLIQTIVDSWNASIGRHLLRSLSPTLDFWVSQCLSRHLRLRLPPPRDVTQSTQDYHCEGICQAGPPTLPPPHPPLLCMGPIYLGRMGNGRRKPKGCSGPRGHTPLPLPANSSGEAQAFPSVSPSLPQTPGQWRGGAKLVLNKRRTPRKKTCGCCS